MRKLIVTLKPGQHYRNPEGKEVIRKQLMDQGYEVEASFDQTLRVYEKAPRIRKELLYTFLLGLMAVGYVILLELILRGKV